MFSPITVIDPVSKEERIITPEEQENLLEKGVVLSTPFNEKSGTKKTND